MISHKLNEIARVADAITILRDGRTIETLDVSVGTVDEDRIIRGMVGRDLEHRFPEHEPSIGELLFEVRDWTVTIPTTTRGVVIRDANLEVSTRRDRRHRRAHGRRPDRARAAASSGARTAAGTGGRCSSTARRSRCARCTTRSGRASPT